ASFLDLLKEPERPAAAPVEPLRFEQMDDAEMERRRRYIEKVVNTLIYDVRNAREGTRNETLRDAAIRCAALIAGSPECAPPEATIAHPLHTAARTCGLCEAEIGSTLPRALEFGRARPSGVPPPQTKRRSPAGGCGAYSNSR